MEQRYDRNCPFCNAEHATFAETAQFRAIYNIAPILPGHSLIVPKSHVWSLIELSDADLAEMVVFSRDCAQLLIGFFEAKGFNWTIQEGEESGQTVPHLHLHLIPRQPNDLPKPGDWYPKMLENESQIIDSDDRERLTEAEVGRIVNQIRKYAATRWTGPQMHRVQESFVDRPKSQ